MHFETPGPGLVMITSHSCGEHSTVHAQADIVGQLFSHPDFYLSLTPRYRSLFVMRRLFIRSRSVSFQDAALRSDCCEIHRSVGVGVGVGIMQLTTSPLEALTACSVAFGWACNFVL